MYREIVPPERLVATERFDDPWYPGEALSAIVLFKADGGRPGPQLPAAGVGRVG
jgi:uncharacterized protein YndB with AHSA1/START domain